MSYCISIAIAFLYAFPDPVGGGAAGGGAAGGGATGGGAGSSGSGESSGVCILVCLQRM